MHDLNQELSASILTAVRRFRWNNALQRQSHYGFSHVLEDGSSSFLPASTTLPSGNSFFEWLRHIGTMDGLPSLLVTHDVGMLYGQIPWKGGSHEIRYQDRLLSVTPLEDGTLGGSYDFNSGALDVVAGEGFIIPARVKGTLTGSRISLDVRDIRFDMRHLNAVFLEPIITFESGIVQGDMLVEGPLGDPDYYGTLRGIRLR